MRFSYMNHLIPKPESDTLPRWPDRTFCFNRARRCPAFGFRDFGLRTSGLIWLLAGSLAVWPSLAGEFTISSFQRDGTLVVSNAFPQGVVTVEKASALSGPWVRVKQAFSVGPVVNMQLAGTAGTGFFRPLAVELSPLWLFSFSDIIGLASLGARLNSQDPSDGVAWWLWNVSPPDLETMIYFYEGGTDPVLQQALVDEFNQLIQGPPIYDADVFAGVVLSPDTQALLAQAPEGVDLARLNRMLLDDAFPVEVRAKQPNEAFTNLVTSYGVLTTVAGAGGSTASPNNKWDPSFEGGSAAAAYLSHPHIAMADRAGNIYIADKEAQGIRKVTTDGKIHTVAGNNVIGYGDTDPVPATSVSLNNPNGLWVREDGVFYILDRDNGLIRKVNTNGIMTLMVNNGGPILEGRGLWVSPDESLLFYAAGSQVRRWDTTNGLTVFADGFWQLGNLAVDPNGNVAVTDRKACFVYHLGSDGSKTVIAGDGSYFNGGDGHLATQTGLYQVRGIWFLPTGAYFLATDAGSQVWYVDTAGYIHLFLNGAPSYHTGDGSWFYDPSALKLSAVRQITMDYDGNLIITENDAGYIRKVQFLRHMP